MKFLLFILSLLVLSCESKRDILLTTISFSSHAVTIENIAKKFGESVDMRSIYPGSEKACYGQTGTANNIFVCINTNKVFVLSFYKKKKNSAFTSPENFENALSSIEKGDFSLHQKMVAFALESGGEATIEYKLLDKSKLQKLFNLLLSAN